MAKYRALIPYLLPLLVFPIVQCWETADAFIAQYLLNQTKITQCERCAICYNCFNGTCSNPGLDITGTVHCPTANENATTSLHFWECVCSTDILADPQWLSLLSACVPNVTSAPIEVQGLLYDMCSEVYRDIFPPPPTGPWPPKERVPGNCGPSDIIVDDPVSLADIDNCTVIYGNLFILAFDNGNRGTPNLQNVTLPPNLHTIYGGLDIESPEGDAYPLAFSAPGLTNIGSHANSTFISPVYPRINGDDSYRGLTIANFPYLSNISFPALNTIAGGLQIIHNRYLRDIVFPELIDVIGNIYIHGNFTVIEIPKLESYGGSFNVQSSSPEFVCPRNFQPNTSNEWSSFVCRGDVTDLADAGKPSIASILNNPGIDPTDSLVTDSKMWVFILSRQFLFGCLY